MGNESSPSAAKPAAQPPSVHTTSSVCSASKRAQHAVNPNPIANKHANHPPTVPLIGFAFSLLLLLLIRYMEKESPNNQRSFKRVVNLSFLKYFLSNSSSVILKLKLLLLIITVAVVNRIHFHLYFDGSNSFKIDGLILGLELDEKVQFNRRLLLLCIQWNESPFLH